MVYERYGPPEVLQLKELEKPVPKDHEVLIKVRATTVTAGDWRARSLIMPGGFGPFGRLVFGVLKPRQPILGCELAGDIEAVGKDVRKFKAGDPVFAFTAVAMGCHAEYKCMAEEGRLALKPPALSYEEAAAISSGGTTALHFFKNESPERREGPHQWRFRRSGHRGGAAGPELRRGGHRRLQRRECPIRDVSRGLQGPRLRQGKLHQERRNL
jgi:NADPH:quinone reductase-like Zn-dependent oxidoreductase